jgi:hypothetical protein
MLKAYAIALVIATAAPVADKVEGLKAPVESQTTTNAVKMGGIRW